MSANFVAEVLLEELPSEFELIGAEDRYDDSTGTAFFDIAIEGHVFRVSVVELSK